MLPAHVAYSTYSSPAEPLTCSSIQAKDTVQSKPTFSQKTISLTKCMTLLKSAEIMIPTPQFHYLSKSAKTSVGLLEEKEHWEQLSLQRCLQETCAVSKPSREGFRILPKHQHSSVALAGVNSKSNHPRRLLLTTSSLQQNLQIKWRLNQHYIAQRKL